MSGDVDTYFVHHFNGQRVDTRSMGSGAQSLETIAGPFAQQTFCHLTAHRVAGAKKKDPWFFHGADFYFGFRPWSSIEARARAAVCRSVVRSSVPSSGKSIPARLHPSVTSGTDRFTSPASSAIRM